MIQIYEEWSDDVKSLAKQINEVKEKMENEQKNIEQPNSVKWAINAKGQLSGECKCYATTPEEALKKASEILVKMESVIKIKNGLD